MPVYGAYVKRALKQIIKTLIFLSKEENNYFCKKLIYSVYAFSIKPFCTVWKTCFVR